MARPRIPRAKAEVAARDKVNPGRFKTRVEPDAGGPLGDPPEWLKEWPRKAWLLFQQEVPWLTASHRMLVEMASNIRGRMMKGEDVGVQAMNLLRQCLGQMGATPADASKITVADDGKEEGPDAEFFG